MSRQPATGNARRAPHRVSVFSQHRREAQRAWRRLVAAPAATLLTVLVIGFALLLPALLGSLQQSLSGGLQRLQAETNLSVYLTLDLNEKEILQISEQLLTMTGVEAIERIDPSAALAQLGATTGLSEALASLTSNPLPTTLLIELASNVTPATPVSDLARSLAQAIGQLDGVDSVTVEGAWLARLEALASVLSRATQLLSLLVGIGLLTAVGNTIRLAVEARRDEIRVSKLIGASDGFVARPFLYTGLFLGLAGGLLGLALHSAVVALIAREVVRLLALYPAGPENPAYSLGTSVLLPLAGALIGWGAAWFASRRAIRQCEP